MTNSQLEENEGFDHGKGQEKGQYLVWIQTNRAKASSFSLMRHKIKHIHERKRKRHAQLLRHSLFSLQSLHLPKQEATLLLLQNTCSQSHQVHKRLAGKNSISTRQTPTYISCITLKAATRNLFDLHHHKFLLALIFRLVGRVLICCFSRVKQDTKRRTGFRNVLCSFALGNWRQGLIK